MILAIGLLNDFVLGFSLLDVDLLRMEQIMKVLLLECIEDIERLLAIELKIGNPLLPLLLGFIDAEGVVVIVSLDRVLEHLGDSALGVLVAPQLAQFLQVQVHVESIIKEYQKIRQLLSILLLCNRKINSTALSLWVIFNVLSST